MRQKPCTEIQSHATLIARPRRWHRWWHPWHRSSGVPAFRGSGVPGKVALTITRKTKEYSQSVYSYLYNLLFPISFGETFNAYLDSGFLPKYLSCKRGGKEKQKLSLWNVWSGKIQIALWCVRGAEGRLRSDADFAVFVVFLLQNLYKGVGT